MNLRTVIQVTAILILLLAVFQFVTHQIALPWSVAGPSMAPTLLQGDRVLVDPWTYRHRAPYVGEVILFDGPIARQDRLVKRVASAPPGGDRKPEPGPWHGLESSSLGIWAVGDNLAQSVDSRTFGPIPRERVIGRVYWRYWPLSRIGRIPPVP